ncbi:MAG TPA: hypothetical protein VIW92_03815 [Thermoanaerobaculia bacterium]
MKMKEILIRGAGALALAGLLAMPAGALTLKRADLDNLVAGNSIIVLAKVDGASSYWAPGTKLILTDFRLSTQKVLKGKVAEALSVTMMGGTVEEYTTLIPGGANLLPGRTYLLFLREESLPGTESVTTVAEHTQGVFDIVEQDGAQWAISQAAGEALIPDEEEREGDPDVPGGAKGMSLDELVRAIQSRVDQQTTGEGVK